MRRHGWPALARARGRILFLMDNEPGSPQRAGYLAGHPSLAGRVLFTNGPPGADDAAFVKRNDPRGRERRRIRRLVRRGYVVRPRADADTLEARLNDTRRRDAALASGAHWVSSDFPAPGLAARFGSPYAVTLPTGTAVRCNPVTAPRRCRTDRLEF